MSSSNLDRLLKSDVQPKQSIENILDIPANELINLLRRVGLFVQDLSNKKAYPNSYWYSWGYSDEDMKFGNFMQFVHPDDREMVDGALTGLQHSDDSFNKVKFRMLTSDGDIRWIYSMALAVFRNEDGSVDRYIGFDFDLTEEMRALENAERLTREAETLASAAAIISSQLTLDETIKAILEQAKRVVPFISASVQLLKDGCLEIVGGSGFDENIDVIGTRFEIPGDNPNTVVIQTREPFVVDEQLFSKYPFFKHKVHPRVSAWMGIPLIHRDEILGMITFDRISRPGFDDNDLRIARNFSHHVAIALQNARLYEKTYSISIRDPLTSVYNRRWMFEQLEQQMELTRRHSNNLALIMFDLDDFKRLNDTYGHLFGDSVLKQVAAICQERLRISDYICRYGGEEFVLILPYTDEKGAMEIAERIRKSCESHDWETGDAAGVTMSLGCTGLRVSDRLGVDDFIGQADAALMQAKKQGKNTCVSYSSMRRR